MVCRLILCLRVRTFVCVWVQSTLHQPSANESMVRVRRTVHQRTMQMQVTTQSNRKCNIFSWRTNDNTSVTTSISTIKLTGVGAPINNFSNNIFAVASQSIDSILLFACVAAIVVGAGDAFHSTNWPLFWCFVIFLHTNCFNQNEMMPYLAY